MRICMLTPVPNADDLSAVGVASAVAWYTHMLHPDMDEQWDEFCAAHLETTADGTLSGHAERMEATDPSSSSLASRLEALSAYIAHRIIRGSGQANPTRAATQAELAKFAKSMKRVARSM